LKIDARIRIPESIPSALTHVQSDLRVATGSRKSLCPHWKFLAFALSMCTWPLQQFNQKHFFLVFKSATNRLKGTLFYPESVIVIMPIPGGGVWW
jgi:hypothetical protein